MLYLIVHADDFGLSRKVNEGILEAHLHGILTSTSIIASGSYFEHAISICESTPSLDVGVHLTLVEEEPILGADKIRSLVNKEGKLHSQALEFTKKYMAGRICLQEVKAELQAQITRVTSSGISISHVESHQHLHMLPNILRVVVQLAKEFGIDAIRIPDESFHINMLTKWSFFSRALELIILKFFCRRAGNIPLARTDYFGGFFCSGKLDKENLQKLLGNLPPSGTCELMCHPGLHDTNSRYRHWGYHWSEELRALTDPNISKLVSARGIKLISYRDLSQIGRDA